MKTLCLCFSLSLWTPVFAGISVAPPGGGSGSTTNLPHVTNLLTGNGTGGASDSGIASTSVVTNFVDVVLLTNKAATFNGVQYNFTASTSAGFNEIQQQFLLTSNTFSGLRIRLMPGDYRFETPIMLTNNTIIEGAGYWATRLAYDGPTNIISLPQVMTNVQEGANNQTTLHTVGLIQLARPAGIYTNLNSGGASWQNFSFAGFSVWSQTNFPCVLIAGYANNFYEDGIGMFGPDVLNTNQGGTVSSIGPILPASRLQPMSVIGQAIDCFQIWTVKDCLGQELADGLLNLGNSFLKVEDTGLLYVGNANGATAGFTNSYPATNWLSVAPAIFVSANAYTAEIDDFFPYRNAVDILADGNVNVGTFSEQNSRTNFVVNTGGHINELATVYGAPSDAGLDFKNGVYYLTNLASWYAENTAANFGSVSYSIYGPNNSTYAYQQVFNDVLVWGFTAADNSETIYPGTNGFYFNGAYQIHGNLGGGTNIPAWNVVGAVTNNGVVRYMDQLGNYVISNQISGATSIIGTNGEAPLTLLFANTNLMTSRGTVLAYDPTGTNVLINGASTNNIGGDQIYDEIVANTNFTVVVLTNVYQDMTFALTIWTSTNTTVCWSTNYGLDNKYIWPSTNGLTQVGTYWQATVTSNQSMTFLYRTNLTGGKQSIAWQVNNQAQPIPGITNTQTGVTLTGGTFSGNGAGLTNISVCQYTNLVNGQLYTNGTTVTMQLTIPVAVSSPAGTLGSAEIDAKTGPKGGTLTTVGDLDIAGGATSILATNKSVLVVNVPSGWTWVTTNSTSGTGYVAGYDATKTNQVLFIP